MFNNLLNSDDRIQFGDQLLAEAKRKQCLSCVHCYSADCNLCYLESCEHCRSEIILCDLHKTSKLPCKFYKKNKQVRCIYYA